MARIPTGNVDTFHVYFYNGTTSIGDGYIRLQGSGTAGNTLLIDANSFHTDTSNNAVEIQARSLNMAFSTASGLMSAPSSLRYF